MSRENKRVADRIEEYLHKNKSSLMNVLLSNTEAVIRQAFKYDHFNKTFIVEPYVVEDMKEYINIDEIDKEWNAELILILNKFYSDKHLNKEEFKKYISSRRTEIQYEWNYLMCSLVLEGYYGLDRKEVRQLLPHDGKVPEDVMTKTQQIITSLTAIRAEDDKKLRERLEEENKNWFQKLISKMRKLFAICVLLVLSVSAFSQFYFAKSISEIRNDGIHLQEINPDLYATKDYPEGTYAFAFGTDRKCYSVMFIPKGIGNLKTMVDWLNQDAIVVSSEEWLFYDPTGKISIYLMCEDGEWFFSFINFSIWEE